MFFFIFSFVYLPLFTSLSKVMRQQDIASQRSLYTTQYPEPLDGVVSELQVTECPSTIGEISAESPPRVNW
jgi:hypothetical protein